MDSRMDRYQLVSSHYFLIVIFQNTITSFQNYTEEQQKLSISVDLKT